MVSMSSVSCTLPWTRLVVPSLSSPFSLVGGGKSKDKVKVATVTTTTTTASTTASSPDRSNDSAFIEPEYYSFSNPASFESSYGGSGSGSGSDPGTDQRHHARPLFVREDDVDNDDDNRRQGIDGNYSSPCPDYEEVIDESSDRLAELRVRQTSPAANPVRRRPGNGSGSRKGVPLTNGLVCNLAPPTPDNNSLLMKVNFRRRSADLACLGWSGTPPPPLPSNSAAATSTASPRSSSSTLAYSQIHCIHKIDGCTWSGPLSRLKGHLNVCQRDAVGCLNRCGAKIPRVSMEDHMLYTCAKRSVTCAYCRGEFAGVAIEDHAASCGSEPVYCEAKCGQKVQRHRMQAHAANACSKRLLRCPHCSRSFTADTLKAHQVSTCSEFPVRCPRGCGRTREGSTSSEPRLIPRSGVERHLAEDCPVALADLVAATTATADPADNLPACIYRDAGCKHSGGDLVNHLRDSVQLHLDLVCSLAHKQEAVIRKLSLELERARQTSFNGVLVWKIRDLASRLKDSKACGTEGSSGGGLELVSVPFYTSQSGYKLQASLFLNGNGSGEGSHLSVYIKLLPGEFDGILRWPFRHTVSFTLLDQNPDRREAVNVVESFLPDPSWPNFQRPSRQDQPDQLGFGFPKFVPHELLASRHYVRDDSVFIKIRVDPCRNVAV